MLCAMTVRYQSAAKELLGKAREALAQGDLLQASEKGWGTAAQITKAVAASRGWPHNSHRLLFDVATRLMQETNDRRLGELWRIANGLHQNFYEQWWDEPQVRGAIDDVAEYVAKLEPLATRSP